MPTERVNHLDLYYEQAGDGPPLVLLHGLGSSAADWSYHAQVFAARYRVIAVDLRGHGQSLDGARFYSVEQMAEDLAGLLAALDTPPAHVLGLSLGGCVAQVLAARHPERVRSLVLVNTFAKLQAGGLAGTAMLARRAWLFCTAPMSAVADYVADGLFPRPQHKMLRDEAAARLARNPKQPYLAAMLAVVRFDSRRELNRIHCPTLVMAGAEDKTVIRPSVLALQRGIAGARFALIEESGHATPYDQPELFNKTVLEFVDQH